MIRVSVLLMFLILSAGVYAQDYDTTSYDDEYTEEYAEDYTDDTSSDYTTTHTTVSPEELEQTKAYQQEELTINKFDKNKWKEIVGDTDYNEEPEKVKDEKKDKKEPPPSSISAPWAAAGFLQIVFYVLIFGIVGFLLWVILKNVSLDVKLRKMTIEEAASVTHVEDIESLDIDGLLNKARQEGDYKLAVRLYYLGLLKKLNTNGVIQWKKDKTNFDYLAELFARNYHYDDVKLLTLTYEEVWYGERVINQHNFQIVTDRFENVFQKINQSAS